MKADFEARVTLMKFLEEMSLRGPPSGDFVAVLLPAVHGAVEKAEVAAKSSALTEQLQWLEKTMAFEQDRREKAGKAMHRAMKADYDARLSFSADAAKAKL